MPGFKTYQAKGVNLAVAQKARVDVALAGWRAPETQQSTVEAARAWRQVETQISELSGVVTGKE